MSIGSGSMAAAASPAAPAAPAAPGSEGALSGDGIALAAQPTDGLTEQRTLQHSGSMARQSVIMGDRSVPEEAMQVTKIHKGARGQAITAMMYVPPDDAAPPGHLGHIWFYLSK